MARPILNVNDVALIPRPAAFAPEGPAADHFAVSTGQLSQPLGARKLGYNISCIPPGKAAYPFHCHAQNEEMFLILAGSGQIRIGKEAYGIREGDVIACPPGGPESAHQIRNTGTGDLRFLAVSTTLRPEICHYPDSDKFGVYATLEVADDEAGRSFYYMGREPQTLDYWAGEGGNPEDA